MKRIFLIILPAVIVLVLCSWTQQTDKYTDKYEFFGKNTSMEKKISYNAPDDNTVILGYLMTETFILKEDVLPAEVLLEAAKKALYKEMNEGLTNVAECQVIFKDQNENPLHTFKLRFSNKHRDSVVIYESQ